MDSLRFGGYQLQQIQEKMTEAYSMLVDALKEIENEQEYLSGNWKGEASNRFMESQKRCLQKVGECAGKTEDWILSLEWAEDRFRQCEKQISKIIGEKCIWEI